MWAKYEADKLRSFEAYRAHLFCLDPPLEGLRRTMWGGERSSTLHDDFSEAEQEASVLDRCSDVKKSPEGVTMPTTFLDFFIYQLEDCSLRAVQLVRENENDVKKVRFLTKLVLSKLYTMCDSLRKFEKYDFGGETFLAEDFTYLNFKRNFLRMRMIMESHSPSEMNAVDIPKLLSYKLLLANGWEINRKMSDLFPKQLMAWFGQVTIFFSRFNHEEIGALQQLPDVDSDGSSLKIRVKRRQARHHYFTTKFDFLRRRGISDVEAGTNSFGKLGVRNLLPEESPCFVAENWMGSSVQEQSMQLSSRGKLEWVDSYTEEQPSELAKIIRNLFWSYLVSPLGEIEQDSVWGLVKEDSTQPDFKDFKSEHDIFEKHVPFLTKFFKKHKDLDFLSDDVWIFGPKFSPSSVAETVKSSELKRSDKHRGLTFVSATDKSEVQSGLIKRHVWKANISSSWPLSHFGLTGSFQMILPIHSEWDYRLENSFAFIVTLLFFVFSFFCYYFFLFILFFSILCLVSLILSIYPLVIINYFLIYIFLVEIQPRLLSKPDKVEL